MVRSSASFLGGACLILLASCQDLHLPEAIVAPIAFDLSSGVQEGEVTLREGAEASVHYKRPYQSSPTLVLVELAGAWAEERHYNKADFQITAQDKNGFKIRNNHVENSSNSWAAVKWRAEGVLGEKPASNSIPAVIVEGTGPSQILVARIKAAGGKAMVEPKLPGAPVIEIDLHNSRTTDADLDMVQGLKHLRMLNLYATRVTDAGLAHLNNLPALQTLYLNETAVTDSGLPQLLKFKKLSELGLNQTQVTDAGVETLAKMSGLHSLELSVTSITDAGLLRLQELRALKHLSLRHTKVSDEAVQRFQRALPNVQILR